jgi:hypothetical protein
MAETKQRFSFSQTAAQQPERQRFSFSSNAPAKKPTFQQTLDKAMPATKMVRDVTAQMPSTPQKPTLGQMAKEFVIPSRGFTDEEIAESKPTFKEKVVGTAKGIAEIGVGLVSLTHMAGNQLSRVLPSRDKEDAERAKEARERLLEKANPFITPKTAGEAQTMRFVDIAGFAPTAVGRISRLSKLDEINKVAKNSLDNNQSGVREKSLNFLRENPNEIKKGEVRLREIEDGSIVIEDGRHRLKVGAEKGITPNIVDVTKEYTGRPSTKVATLIKNATEPVSAAPSSRFSFADNAKQAPVPVARQAVGDIDVSTLPKIEQRFVGNFPKFKSAERLNELRNRTRSPQSNAESLAKAQQLGYTSDRVLRIPEGTALNAEQKMAVSGVVENERLILQRIEDRLKTIASDTSEFNALRGEASRQKVKVFQMMAVERGVAAEAGRTLQAYKATVSAIDQAKNKLAKYLASKKTPQETKDYIYRKIEEFDGTPNELNKLLRELDEATLIEKFVEYATAAKLWNPTTHAVNVLTSISRMFLQSPIHALSASFDSVLSKLTGAKRERFLSDAYAEVQGQYMGWKHAGHEALKALKDENYAFDSRILKDFEVKGPAIKGRPGKNKLRDKIADGFGKAVRIPFRMLGVEDMLIRKPSEMGALYTAINRKARMEGLKPGTKEWDDYVAKAITDPVGEYGIKFMEEIQNIADQNLFQEALHPTLRKVSGWREDVPAIKLIVPFFRTIVNLQKQAIEFSALAPILPGARKALREGGGARSDVLAKMTLGTAATVPLVHHAMEGNMTMSAPTNPAERDAFYAEGKQPYSIRLGDTWYSYNRFSPFSEWFISSAALADAYNNEDEKTATELISHVFFSLTQNFFDKSFATGMHDLMEALNDPERAGNWVQNFATGATIPNFIPLAARVVDPVIRETDDLRDAYISKVPYLSKTLDPRRDVFGKPISRPGNAIQKIVSPVIPSPVEVDMVREELKTIGYQMGFPGKTAGGFQMDDETYRIYQAASGKIIYKALSQMMQNEGYQNLTPRQKERAVDKIVRESRELVKNQVAQEQLIMQGIKEELKRQGYSSKQADDLAVKTYEIIKRKQEAGQGQ